jgi:suppressor of ftsI
LCGCDSADSQRRRAATTAAHSPVKILSRATLFLTLQRSHWSFTQGTRAGLGINGRYLGPTNACGMVMTLKLIYSNRQLKGGDDHQRIAGARPLIGGAARDVANADCARC